MTQSSLIVALSLLFVGCGRTQPAPSAAQPAAAPGTTAVPTPSAATDKPDTRAAATTEPDALAPAANVVAKANTHAVSEDDLRAVLDARGGATHAKAVASVLDEMIDVALLADLARDEGFADNPEIRHATDRVLAELLVQHKLRAELATAVTAEDVASYWAERRRATKLVVADEARARELQTRLTAAIAAAPEKATTIFAEVRAEHGVAGARDPQSGVRTPFDARGRSAVGAAIEHVDVAGAAFALTAVGDVSEPVALGDGRWALVLLLEITPTVAPAALTAPQRSAAQQALIDARLDDARRDWIARLRRDADVSIDTARLETLARALTKAKRRKLPFDIKRWRRDTLRGKHTRPAGLSPNVQPMTVTDEQRLEMAQPKGAPPPGDPQ